MVFDERYQGVKAAKAKKELIKSEWLEAFKTVDETKKRPIDNVFSGEELSSKILERMAKDRIEQDREVTV